MTALTSSASTANAAQPVARIALRRIAVRRGSEMDRPRVAQEINVRQSASVVEKLEHPAVR